MTGNPWMVGAAVAPFLVFAMAASAAGGAVGSGPVELLPDGALIDGGVLWPSSDLLRNLCPEDTVEAADCTVVKPRLGGGGPRRQLLDLDDLPQVVEPGLEALRVDLRFADLAGELAAISTACGVWSGTYELDSTGPSAIFPLWLTTGEVGDGGDFLGTFEAVTRFDFVRESDGRRVTLVRTIAWEATGTWGLMGGNLGLRVGPAPPPIGKLGHCRLKDPPQIPE